MELVFGEAMSERVSHSLDRRAAQVRALHQARARAELLAADGAVPGADAVPWSGEVIADIALVKGMPGPAEAAGGAALTGADGQALDKALAALGYDPVRAFRTVARPVTGAQDADYAARLRMQIEAVDPRVVIALDARAAHDVGAAFGLAPLSPGKPAAAAGRRLVAIADFEASLTDDALKRAAWLQLQAAKPAGPVY